MSHASLGVPFEDEAGYLLVDDHWRIVAADDVSHLAADAGSAALVGHLASDVIGPAAVAALEERGAATFTLENIEYVLTCRAFDLPTGRVRLIRAQEMEATVEHVVSLIVHEVRNPLSAMRALVQGLEEEIGHRPDCLPYTSRLTGEIDRLSRLLLSMAQVARLRARPPELVQLAELLQHVAAIYQAELASRGIRVQVATSPRVELILGDPDQLQQILGNLVKNAAEATASGGTITLRARLDPRGRPLLQVEDTGIGMTAEEIERALRPRQSSKPGGMGLGLMIVRGIVRQHGARLRVSSTPGRGTLVSITFPRVEESSGAPA
jgi:two-component system, sporulation sensor kinase A